MSDESEKKEKELLTALKEFLAFGHPCEGSFRYHDAWKKLKETYEQR